MVNPVKMIDGLAVYSVGKGPLVFLMPYPHASSNRSSAEGRFAELIVNAGYTVISFDPPGFARSDRNPSSELQEMLNCSLECLQYFNIKEAIPFIGHSMAGFCAIAFAIHHPEKVSKLVISGSPSGWEDVNKYSIHRKWKIWQKQFWQTYYRGGRIILNMANLKIHRLLDNLMAYESFYDKSYFEEIEIEKHDHKKPPPPRAIWLKHVRKYDYRSRLSEIKVPTWITAGIHDPIVPVVVSENMAGKIANSKITYFEKSGHSPFIEEKEKYSALLKEFLAGDQKKT
jgi:proline iminopeptidase